MLAKPQLAEHADIEAHVPSVLVACYERFALRAVLVHHRLRPDVAELDVLEVRAYHYAEVERAQVGIWPVLYGVALGGGMHGHG